MTPQNLGFNGDTYLEASGPELGIIELVDPTWTRVSGLKSLNIAAYQYPSRELNTLALTAFANEFPKCLFAYEGGYGIKLYYLMQLLETCDLLELLKRMIRYEVAFAMVEIIDIAKRRKIDVALVRQVEQNCRAAVSLSR